MANLVSKLKDYKWPLIAAAAAVLLIGFSLAEKALNKPPEPDYVIVLVTASGIPESQLDAAASHFEAMTAGDGNDRNSDGVVTVEIQNVDMSAGAGNGMVQLSVLLNDPACTLFVIEDGSIDTLGEENLWTQGYFLPLLEPGTVREDAYRLKLSAHAAEQLAGDSETVLYASVVDWSGSENAAVTVVGLRFAMFNVDNSVLDQSDWDRLFALCGIE